MVERFPRSKSHQTIYYVITGLTRDPVFENESQL